MEGIQQVALPIVGIVAAAALTFYVVSFNELREKSLRYEDESEERNEGFRRSSLTSKQKRAARKAKRDAKSP